MTDEASKPKVCKRCDEFASKRTYPVGWNDVWNAVLIFFALSTLFVVLELVSPNTRRFDYIAAVVLPFAAALAAVKFTYEYVKRDIIGQKFYVFLDNAGYLHYHDRPDDDFGFRLRSGGWFRANSVYGSGGNWTIVKCWDGSGKLTLMDRNGNSVSFNKGYLEDALRFACLFYCVLEARTRLYQVTDNRNELAGYLETASHRAAKYTGYSCTLGKEICKAIMRLEASKQTLGRSKHAHAFRLNLEAVLAKFDPALVEGWNAAALQEFATEAIQRDSQPVA